MSEYERMRIEWVRRGCEYKGGIESVRASENEGVSKHRNDARKRGCTSIERECSL